MWQVHKICGPGNQFVTAAKMTLQNSEAMVAMDMPAGPSEVLVIADHTASPAHIAADLLSQAEHGPDSQVPFPHLTTTQLGSAQRHAHRKFPCKHSERQEGRREGLHLCG